MNSNCGSINISRIETDEAISTINPIQQRKKILLKSEKKRCEFPEREYLVNWKGKIGKK